jgi:hypothetical protein
MCIGGASAATGSLPTLDLVSRHVDVGAAEQEQKREQQQRATGRSERPRDMSSDIQTDGVMTMDAEGTVHIGTEEPLVPLVLARNDVLEREKGWSRCPAQESERFPGQVNRGVLHIFQSVTKPSSRFRRSLRHLSLPYAVRGHAAHI